RGGEPVLGRPRAHAAGGHHVAGVGTAVLMPLHRQAPDAARAFGDDLVRQRLRQGIEYDAGDHLPDDVARADRCGTGAVHDRPGLRDYGEWHDAAVIVRQVAADRAAQRESDIAAGVVQADIDAIGDLRVAAGEIRDDVAILDVQRQHDLDRLVVAVEHRL